MNGVLAAEGNIEWSEVVGLPGHDGMRFRGRRAQANWFYAAIPTPNLRDDVTTTSQWMSERRARLARVMVRYATDPEVTISGMRVFDGDRDTGFPFPSLPSGPNFSFFEHPTPPEVGSCICVEFHVEFNAEGTILFSSVGCDFII